MSYLSIFELSVRDKLPTMRYGDKYRQDGIVSQSNALHATGERTVSYTSLSVDIFAPPIRSPLSTRQDPSCQPFIQL